MYIGELNPSGSTFWALSSVDAPRQVPEESEDPLKTPSTDIPIPKLADGIRLALVNARRLAVAAATSADAQDLHAAAVLLYQAAEEIGKAKLLKDHLDAGRPVATDGKSAFRNHSTKFHLAIRITPPDCLEVWGPAFDPAVFDPRVFQTEPVPVDWQRRQESLYLNWDDGSGDWQIPAVPDQRVVRTSALRMVSFIDSLVAGGIP